MPKIRFKLFRSILTAIICLGVISVYTYAYLYKKGGVTTPVGKNSETILKQFLFGVALKNYSIIIT